MKHLLYSALALALTAVSTSAIAQRIEAPTGAVTAEYYYRIKWGGHAEFKELYERNHALNFFFTLFGSRDRAGR